VDPEPNEPKNKNDKKAPAIFVIDLKANKKKLFCFSLFEGILT
jgi:hypothetical protein